MNLTCPCCGGRFSIEAALTDDAAREAVAAALRLPAPLGDSILRYLGLFRPDKRALSWDRAARILTELLEPIQRGQVERHGRAWAAPLDAWKGALEQMLASRDKLQLPLKSHAYLFEIVAGAAGRAEGRREQQNEDERRYRHSRESTNGPVHVGRALARRQDRDDDVGLKSDLQSDPRSSAERRAAAKARAAEIRASLKGGRDEPA